MADQPNKYNSMPLTGKSNRKIEETASTVLAVPYLKDEAHEYGEQPGKINNRINDQVKSGKRRGAMVLSSQHGLMVASGSGEKDAWYTVQFEVATIGPA